MANQVGNTFFSLTFQLDNKADYLEYRVYTFSVVLEEIGGLTMSLYLFGLIVCGFFRN